MLHEGYVTSATSANLRGPGLTWYTFSMTTTQRIKAQDIQAGDTFKWGSFQATVTGFGKEFKTKLHIQISYTDEDGRTQDTEITAPKTCRIDVQR